MKKYTFTQVQEYTYMLVHKYKLCDYISTQLHYHSSIQILKDINTKVNKYASKLGRITQVHKYISMKVYKYTSTEVP